MAASCANIIPRHADAPFLRLFRVQIEHPAKGDTMPDTPSLTQSHGDGFRLLVVDDDIDAVLDELLKLKEEEARP